MDIYQENGRNIITYVLLDSKLHFLHLSLQNLCGYVQLSCFNETPQAIAAMFNALKALNEFILVHTHVHDTLMHVL